MRALLLPVLHKTLTPLATQAQQSRLHGPLYARPTEAEPRANQMWSEKAGGATIGAVEVEVLPGMTNRPCHRDFQAHMQWICWVHSPHASKSTVIIAHVGTSV